MVKVIRIDCYKCDVCSELMPKEYITEDDGFRCGECNEIFDNLYDAEYCCSKEEEEEEDGKN